MNKSRNGNGRHRGGRGRRRRGIDGNTALRPGAPSRHVTLQTVWERLRRGFSALGNGQTHAPASGNVHVPNSFSGVPDATLPHTGKSADRAGDYTMKKRGTTKAYVDGARCAGCGLCADRCFKGAITIDRIAVIDTAICTGCGKCVDVCPAGALELR